MKSSTSFNNAWIISANPADAGLARGQRPISPPGPGQVRVRMLAASLNYRDLLVVDRRYAAAGDPVHPIVPLSDGVGVVTDVGPGVTRVQVGDRVAAAFMPGWTEGDFSAGKMATALGGGTVDGVLTHERLFEAEGLVQVPAHLTDEEAATLPCAAVTAWYALFVGQALKPGQTLLTLGTGGVSLFAVQFARLAGARVIITSSDDGKLERARELGAHEAINYRRQPQWSREVLRLTEGRGADLAVEVGGPGTLNETLASVRHGGGVSLMGVLTGLAAPVDTGLILHKQIKVQGTYVGSRAMFEAMNAAIALHRLRPVVDRVFPFEEARAALAYLKSGRHFGKVVIRIAS